MQDTLNATIMLYSSFIDKDKDDCVSNLQGNRHVQILEFLQVMASQGKPMQWKSALGFPIEQPYRMDTTQIVLTGLQVRTIRTMMWMIQSHWHDIMKAKLIQRTAEPDTVVTAELVWIPPIVLWYEQASIIQAASWKRLDCEHLGKQVLVRAKVAAAFSHVTCMTGRKIAQPLPSK